LAQRYITLLYGMPEYNKMRKLARTRGQEQERSNKRVRTNRGTCPQTTRHGNVRINRVFAKRGRMRRSERQTRDYNSMIALG
jgi:hypothetical protein